MTQSRHWLRRCSRSALAALIACLALTQVPSAHSHESDQFTLPAGRDFADLGPYFTKIAYDAIVGATTEANAAIAQAVVAGSSPSQLEELQSAEFIAGKVWQHLFLAIPVNEILDLTLVNDAVQSRYPGLVTMYRPPVAIYDDPLLVIDLTKGVRTFFRAGSINAGGIVFGTDKLIHFINVGRIYHSKFEARIKRGLPEKEAIKSAIASTSRNPLTSEHGVLGMWTTGIVSNGDLAADYAGLMFYRNLTETVRIGPRTLPPMLVREGPYWRVQVDPDSDFFIAFITPHWNEVLNPSVFANYTSGRLEALIHERCQQTLAWYRDPRGQPRSRAEFEAIERELSTYYGDPYGHDGNPAHGVTIANVCFPKRADAAGGASAMSHRPGTTLVAASPRDGAGSAPLPGPDPFGRTPVWWAAREGNVAELQALAPARTDIDAADLDGETPLHAATRAGSAAAVRELLSLGADPNRAALYGVTPLMLAATTSRLDVAVLLLQAGASPNARDLFGATALHVAARRGNHPLTERLLEAGADPRIADDGGNTALHLAAHRGDEKNVTMLLARGADKNARNAAGLTPRDEAERRGHGSTVQQLAPDARATSTTPHHGISTADAAAPAHVKSTAD
jgi:ankyrin repeat protein